jgi:hypothetical protein
MRGGAGAAYWNPGLGILFRSARSFARKVGAGRNRQLLLRCPPFPKIAKEGHPKFVERTGQKAIRSVLRSPSIDGYACCQHRAFDRLAQGVPLQVVRLKSKRPGVGLAVL